MSVDPAAIERVIARDAIAQLAMRYSDALSRGDVDGIAELYAPSARFGAAGHGPEGCRRFFADALDGLGLTVVMVANHTIELDGDDAAHGSVWAHGYIDDPVEGFIHQLIRYDDRYERVDGAWRFVSRRHELWLGWRHGDHDPLAQSAADWPKRQVGRGRLFPD